MRDSTIRTFEKYYWVPYTFPLCYCSVIELNSFFFPRLTSVAIDVSFVETFIAVVFCSLPSRFHSLFTFAAAFNIESITLADSAHANAVAFVFRAVTSFTKLERTSKEKNRTAGII